MVGHAASENFRRPVIGCHFSSVSLSLHLSIYPSSLIVSIFILFLKNSLNIGVWLNYPLDGCFLYQDPAWKPGRFCASQFVFVVLWTWL